jgi:sarcosine oxidase gamma subunit
VSSALARLASALGGDPGPEVGDVRCLTDGPDILTDGPRRWLLRYAPDAARPGDIPGITVTDMSDSMLGVRVHGALALELLATGCPLDLASPEAAPVSCARSVFQHLPLLVHRLDPKTMDLYVPRSYISDFQDALLAAAHAIVALQPVDQRS